MKASFYNILIPDPTSGRSILFNSLYGSTAILGPSERVAAEQMLCEPLVNGKNRTELYAQLCRQMYLVPEDTDELAIIRRRKEAGIRDPNRLDLILMPTLDCNFACPYCYEERRPSRLTQQMTEAIKRWMSAEIPKHKVLLLSWFGGEPLMGYRSIVDLSGYALQTARSHQVAFIGHMTSNGYLLSPSRAKRLIELEILDYQVTVDGDRLHHDRVRILRNGAGTFDRILQNVIYLLRLDNRVRVSIRINFGMHNLDSVPSLLQAWPEDIRSRIRISLEPVFGHCGLAAARSLKNETISESLAEYYSLAEREGYSAVHGLKHCLTGKLVYCYAERESQYIINYTGDVFKCSVCKFQPEERVGYIDDQGILVKDDKQWQRFVGHTEFTEACRQCAYLPLCMGGCRKNRLATGDACSACCLVPTNASYVLKQIAYGRLGRILRDRFQPEQPRAAGPIAAASGKCMGKEVICEWKS